VGQHFKSSDSRRAICKLASSNKQPTKYNPRNNKQRL